MEAIMKAIMYEIWPANNKFFCKICRTTTETTSGPTLTNQFFGMIVAEMELKFWLKTFEEGMARLLKIYVIF